MLSRLRNGISTKNVVVKLIPSRLSLRIAEILEREGFIDSFDIKLKGKTTVLLIKLKYKNIQQPCITNLIRVSKPGLRVYTKAFNIPRVLGGLGIAVYSS